MQKLSGSVAGWRKARINIVFRFDRHAWGCGASARNRAEGEHDEHPNLLAVEGLTKLFGSFAACDGIDLKIGHGEIHALLGENGAGKSTLVKMLFGILAPSSGRVCWKGKPEEILSPAARRLGIGMVFQHFSLFEALTVAENIALALDENVSIDEISQKAAELSRAYGLPLDPSAHVWRTSRSASASIEIVRALLQNPKLIILDEPTSVLTPQEADGLFETLFKLKAEGRSVLYISHKTGRSAANPDRATVLRHGKVTGACDPRGETPATLADDGRRRGRVRHARRRGDGR